MRLKLFHLSIVDDFEENPSSFFYKRVWRYFISLRYELGWEWTDRKSGFSSASEARKQGLLGMKKLCQDEILRIDKELKKYETTKNLVVAGSK